MAADKKLKPGPVPKLVGEYLINEKKRDADWVWHLQAVVRPSGQKFDIRVFDNDETTAKRVSVNDYTSLETHPELVMYEGQFDEGSKRVELKEKINLRANQDDEPYTFTEIWNRIAMLSEPGSSAVFYVSGSPSTGGPFGRGAAVVELNPNYPGKKEKKYTLYFSNMDGTKLVGTKQKFVALDKSKQVAGWIKERHSKT